MTPAQFFPGQLVQVTMSRLAYCVPNAPKAMEVVDVGSVLLLISVRKSTVGLGERCIVDFMNVEGNFMKFIFESLDPWDHMKRTMHAI